MIATSPLRYPGGKQVLANVLARLIKLNDLQGGVYAEPYAGGAGAALALLFGEHVEAIAINDADVCVYSMWQSMLGETSAFIDKIRRATLTVRAWRRHRSIYRSPQGHSALDVGFATFFLNRCNRSGIISTGGPIGGISQLGKWKIDARFNRETLIRRVEKIVEYKKRIRVTNLDALVFLRRLALRSSASDTFVYLDPPYFEKGRELYMNYYDEHAHGRLAKYLAEPAPFAWVLTYDNVPRIRQLYAAKRQSEFSLDYTARERRRGKELLVVQDGLRLPDGWERRIPKRYISSADQVRVAA